jgi:hypothetical protein
MLHALLHVSRFGFLILLRAHNSVLMVVAFSFMRDCVDTLLTDQSWATYLTNLKDSFWVDGVWDERCVCAVSE